MTSPSSTPQRSIRRNVSWTIAGNATYAASQWLILVLLAKLAPPEKVGQFALGLAVSAPLFMFLGLHLRVIQATDARQEFEFSDYLTLRVASSVLGVVAGAALAIVLYRPETAAIVALVCATKALEAVSEIYFGYLQRNEALDRVAISLMARALLTVAVVAVALSATRSIATAVLAMAAVRVLVLFVVDVPFARRHATTPDQLAMRVRRTMLLRLVWVALPMACVMMINSLTANVPRYFVERSLGERNLGIFAAIGYVVVAGTTVVSAIGDSTSPRLARYWAEGNVAAFRALLLKMAAVCLFIGLAGLAVAALGGRFVLRLVYTAEYAAHVDLFVWTMVFGVVSYLASVVGVGVTAMRKFRVQVPIHVASLAVMSLGCFWFVRRHGLLGASFAMLVSSLFTTGAYALVLLTSLVARTRGALGAHAEQETSS